MCKSGLGDVMLGAAATVADYNGVAKASHIKARCRQGIFIRVDVVSPSVVSLDMEFRI